MLINNYKGTEIKANFETYLPDVITRQGTVHRLNWYSKLGA
jgi:hypothetical protein